MIKQPRKFSLKNGFTVVILMEVAAVVTAYGFFRAVNHNSEFRYKLYTKNSLTKYVLEAYYTIGEKTSSEFNVRTFDKEMWKTLGRDL